MNELTVRKLKETDLETLRKWRTHPEVTKHLFTDPVITAKAQRKWYDRITMDGDSLFWIIDFKGKDIGYTSLSNIDWSNKKCELNVCIGEMEYRGKGLGRTVVRVFSRLAFDELPMNKLYAIVFSDNYPSIVSYFKNGWKIDGILRDHIFKYGKFHDAYMLSLLKRGMEE